METPGGQTYESRQPSSTSTSSTLPPPPTPSSPLHVYSWGRGEDGQLGVGDTSDQSLPILVSTFLGDGGVGPKTISCGSGHTVVLR